ncbi:hypothetical protein OG782_37200 (plasmid) [Streptomyces sp. NBC_00876]|uniref:hypothetical protein n=1 Tax=Streptomyces sp. NBC_00876 TaxID=2975853 RepID=UPI002F91738B|nr:hypothetical protein OG782_37200 [Streptomyces sp. NBC_00876]
MKNIANIIVTATAAVAAVLTTAGISAADDGIGWPRTAGTTQLSADGIGWPVAPQGDIGWPVAPQGTTDTADPTIGWPVAPQGDIGWPVAPTA